MLSRLLGHFRNRVKVHGCFHRTQIRELPAAAVLGILEKILEVPCQTVQIPHIVRLDEISDYRIPHIRQALSRPHTAEMLLVSQQYTFFFDGAVNKHGRRYHFCAGMLVDGLHRAFECRESRHIIGRSLHTHTGNRVGSKQAVYFQQNRHRIDLDRLFAAAHKARKLQNFIAALSDFIHHVNGNSVAAHLSFCYFDNTIIPQICIFCNLQCRSFTVCLQFKNGKDSPQKSAESL